MTGKTFSTMLRASAVGVVAAFCFCATSFAQPDSDYSTGDLVVHAPYRQERTFSGAPIVIARAQRVVDYSDLDLSTRWGVRALRDRVERAAADACDQLQREWAAGLYDLDGDNADCINYAVEDAMSQAPITYVDYGRRYDYGY